MVLIYFTGYLEICQDGRESLVLLGLIFEAWIKQDVGCSRNIETFLLLKKQSDGETNELVSSPALDRPRITEWWMKVRFPNSHT